MGKQLLQLIGLNFRKWTANSRVWMIFFIEFAYLWISTIDIKELAVSKGIGISCFYFVIWNNEMFGRLLMFLGIVVLFCNAPFLDDQQLFVIGRVGKKTWFLGQLIYMFLASAVYFLVMAVFCILRYFPYIGFSTGWGDVIKYKVDNVEIVENFSPIPSMLMVYGICVAVGFFLGLVICYVNLYKKGTLGIVIAAVFVVFTYLIKMFDLEFSRRLMLFSLVDWCDLNNYVPTDYLSFVTIPYVVGILVVANGLLLTANYRKAKSFIVETS